MRNGVGPRPVKCLQIQFVQRVQICAIVRKSGKQIHEVPVQYGAAACTGRGLKSEDN